MVYQLAVFAPLFAFLLAMAGARYWGLRGVQALTIGSVALATVCAGWSLIDTAYRGHVHVETLGTWLALPDWRVSWALQIDTLSALMCVIVNTISLLVHIYAVGYMARDPHAPRFMAYLSLFTFMMLILVVSDNLLQLFLGWEGVGLASYLLIGFWQERSTAGMAAVKAFVVNRIADVGLLLGIAVLFSVFHNFDMTEILDQAPTVVGQTWRVWGYDVPVLELAAALLFIGAMGKSAQVCLHVWLPDAMEGPTPVSALLHAATMVTAGVYLVCRLSGLYELAPYTKTIILLVGAKTAIFAGTLALVQHDIKRVIAYSTASQLGYMFMAAGAGGYTAAMFHLFTHAFFKALLFLGAGSVIHALVDQQDMRQMGGLWRKMPWTHGLMWVGTLALVGLPLFAGYYSKELMIESVMRTSGFPGMYARTVSLFMAFLTALYSARLMGYVFYGQPRGDANIFAHAHDPERSMRLPMLVLAGGAVLGGVLPQAWGWFDAHAVSFWGSSLALPFSQDAHVAVPIFMSLSLKALTLAGLALGLNLYAGNGVTVARWAQGLSPLPAIVRAQWGIVPFYKVVFVRPFEKLSHFFATCIETHLIDRGPQGIANLVRATAGRVRGLQTGHVVHYVAAMIGGSVFLIIIYMAMR